MEACNNDITTHCGTALVNNDDDDDSDDADGMQDDADEREPGVDRDLGGRVIECLRSKYANTNVQLDAQCRTELIDVIQASKIDIQFDVRLYQECKNVLRNYCPGADKEDCLRVLYQHRNISDYKCKLQVLRVIREGKADIHVDPSLLANCQADITKFCNDIPIGECAHVRRVSASPASDRCSRKRQAAAVPAEEAKVAGEAVQGHADETAGAVAYGTVLSSERSSARQRLALLDLRCRRCG